MALLLALAIYDFHGGPLRLYDVDGKKDVRFQYAAAFIIPYKFPMERQRE